MLLSERLTPTNVQTVLHRLGIELQGQANEDGWITIHSPLREENKPSFGLNVNNGAWCDHATGDKGDLVTLVERLDRVDRGKAIQTIKEISGLKGGAFNGSSQKQPIQKTKQPEYQQVIPAPQPANNAHACHPKFGKPSSAWTWYTTHGKLIGYTCRYDHSDGKDILPLTWQKSDYVGGWKFKGFETPRPLYNLPELNDRTDAPVLVVEGEKCAEAAKKLFPSLVVTTWMGGAGATEKTDWTPLHGRAICVWPDNDEPGRQAMKDIAKMLVDYVPVINYIANPENAPDHWDIADAHWTKLQAHTYVKQNTFKIHPNQSKQETATAEPISDESYTVRHSEVLDEMMKRIPFDVDFRELANLQEDEKLKTRHYIVYSIKEILLLANELKWNICEHNESVYLFNGCYWSRIEDDELKRFLGEAAKNMGWEESFSDHFQQRDHLFKQFICEAYLPAPERDKNRVVINLQNGTFEIENDGTRIRDFDPADFLTHQLPFEYEPDAKATKFNQYLSEVLPDEALRKVLQEYAGYIFLPTTSLKLEKVLMLFGSGANGKSVFFDILKALVGHENFSTYSLQSLTNDNGYYRADLADRLVNYASEISGRVQTSYFKTLASGEPIEARLPYKNPVTIHEYARLIFNVNQLPHDVEHTEGFFRRFLIIPFEETIPEEKRDRNLAKTIIRDELPGVFNWVLQGLHRLIKQGNFTYSDKVEREISSYRRESDSVALYMDDSGHTKSLNHWKTQKDLYEAYRVYAYDNGYKPVSNIKFGKRLDNIGFTREAKSAGQVVYVEKVRESALF